MRELWQRLRSALQNLSMRERALVSAVGVVVVGALLFVLVVQPALDAAERARERVAAAEQQLAAMTRLRQEFEEVRVRLDAVEQRIQGGARGNLRTTLESMASEASVRVESMEPQSSPANDSYVETKVEVGLGGVTLAQMVNYLHRIEESNQVLSIKSLRVRTRADKPELLDVTFTVSSFEPI
jgi:type II secretory pathway component PulM